MVETLLEMPMGREGDRRRERLEEERIGMGHVEKSVAGLLGDG
jgi:hypothetical protein